MGHRTDAGHSLTAEAKRLQALKIIENREL
jgi:hypothetical protein